MKIRFFPCGVAELIHISFDDNTNIIIDTGLKRHYTMYLKPILLKEDIKLLILTHTDEDHIGGLVKLLESGDEKLLCEKVETIWFNWSSLKFKTKSDDISVKQAVFVRDRLDQLGVLRNDEISTLMAPLTINKSTVHILSPNTQKLDKSKSTWTKSESSFIAAESDYHHSIEDLLEKPFVEDYSVWNGGSIAILIESDHKKVLLLADAHPSVIAKALCQKFGCSSINPIRVDCVKVSHHGSRANTSIELLELIECKDWIFCANGAKNGFPHKECIARIINHRKKSKDITRIILNHNRPSYAQIFDVDDNAMDLYNFILVHLDDGNYDFK